MNIAIVGCGYIATRVAGGIMFSEGNLYAVAARDKERARQFSLKFPDCKYMDYDEVFSDESVDMVYISTINETHYGLIKRALESGKHVICEKPILANQEQIKEVFALAREKGLFLMEAHKTCFTVLNRLLKPIINEKIGKLTHIYGQYCSTPDIRMMNSDRKNELIMGGARYDIGCYPLTFANYYAASEIKDFTITSLEKAGLPCDIEMTAYLVYENGVTANVKCSWIDPNPNRGILYGEKGRIEIINFWKGTEATVFYNDGTKEEIRVEQDSDFTGEVNEAVRCTQLGLSESPVMSEKASLEIVKVLEKVKEF